MQTENCVVIEACACCIRWDPELSRCSKLLLVSAIRCVRINSEDSNTKNEIKHYKLKLQNQDLYVVIGLLLSVCKVYDQQTEFE